MWTNFGFFFQIRWVQVPDPPVSYFHAGGTPSLALAGPTSLRVTYGAPEYDGGDRITSFQASSDLCPPFVLDLSRSPPNLAGNTHVDCATVASQISTGGSLLTEESVRQARRLRHSCPIYLLINSIRLNGTGVPSSSWGTTEDQTGKSPSMLRRHYAPVAFTVFRLIA